MRQWPSEHFAALIDLLVETHDVNVLLIGGPDEVDLAQEVLDKVVRRKAVVSVTGKTSLAELTQLLACCALYVGNNSGPKHIAAAIGTPTIGVHSGVIDSVEWAPIGKRALALRRNMSCSPCYLARPVDCPRNLDCLRQLEPVNVWQACRTLLVASRMPVYDVVPTAQPVVAAVEVGAEMAGSPPERRLRAGRPADVAAEIASPPGRRRSRAGRRDAAGNAMSAPAVAIDASAQAEAPTGRAAGDAVASVADVPANIAPLAEREGESVESAQSGLEPAVLVEVAASVAAPSAADEIAPPSAIDALNQSPEPTGEEPGGGETEEAVTTADEPDAAQVSAPTAESQSDRPDD